MKAICRSSTPTINNSVRGAAVRRSSPVNVEGGASGSTVPASCLPWCMLCHPSRVSASTDVVIIRLPPVWESGTRPGNLDLRSCRLWRDRAMSPATNPGKMHTDSRRPLALDTKELPRRPGRMLEGELQVAAPEHFGTDVISVPEGQQMTLRLRLESVMEGVLVTGTVEATATGACVRCLEPVDLLID